MELQALISDNPLNGFMNNENLITQLNTEFTSDEQKQFVMNFYLYQKYDKTNDFVIDLDKIWTWIGFAQKVNAKTLLQKYFTQDIHYKILLLRTQEQINNEDNRGGHNKETIMMTINTFKSLCLKSRTSKAIEIHDYYIKLEDIIMSSLMKCMETTITNANKQAELLQDKNQELLKKLELANEKNKNTKETAGYIYIATNLKEIDKQTYKVGFAIDEKSRESSMNTSEMDGCFKILEKFYTKDRILSEKIIHTYLIYHKFHYSKEFFTIKLNELINICKYFTKIVDQTTDTSMNILYERLVSSDTTHLTTVNNDNSVINPVINNNPVTNINIQLPTKKFKFFTLENYKQFIEEHIISKNNSHVFTEQIRNAFGKWQNDKNIKPKIYKSGQMYLNKLSFKTEFKDILQEILEIPQTRIHVLNKKKISGFTNISLRDN
jgi:hypothetical protein